MVLFGMTQVVACTSCLLSPLSLLLECMPLTFVLKPLVEAYHPDNNTWTSCPSLNRVKGSLAGAAVNNKLFALGGGNGHESFSDVEMLDLDVGRWIPTQSMVHKVIVVFL